MKNKRYSGAVDCLILLRVGRNASWSRTEVYIAAMTNYSFYDLWYQKEQF